MATATKLPKLKWEKRAAGVWVADPDGQRYEVEKIGRSWQVTSNDGYLGDHGHVDGAKRIAQAFADSEAARKGEKS